MESSLGLLGGGRRVAVVIAGSGVVGGDEVAEHVSWALVTSSGLSGGRLSIGGNGLSLVVSL